MTNLWESLIAHAWMNGALHLPANMAQLTLACALGMAARNADIEWRSGRPKLSAWFDAFASRSSFAATAVSPS